MADAIYLCLTSVYRHLWKRACAHIWCPGFCRYAQEHASLLLPLHIWTQNRCETNKNCAKKKKKVLWKMEHLETNPLSWKMAGIKSWVATKELIMVMTSPLSGLFDGKRYSKKCPYSLSHCTRRQTNKRPNSTGKMKSWATGTCKFITLFALFFYVWKVSQYVNEK